MRHLKKLLFLLKPEKRRTATNLIFSRPANISNITRRNTFILCILLLTGCILRFSYLLELRQTPFFNPQLLSGMDQRTWDNMSVKVLAYPWFVDGQPFYQAPGYAYFLGLIYSIFGIHNYLAVGVVQGILDILAAFLIFLIGRRLWNDWVGLTACGIYSLYRPFIYFSATILSDSFILFTNILCLFLVYRVLGQPEKRSRWFLAGLGFGLATITKPTIFLFLFFTSAAFLLSIWVPRFSKRQDTRSPSDGGHKKYFLTGSLIFLLGFLLLVLPVAIRNSLLAGRIVTVATYGDINWKIGNSTDSLGLFMYPKGPLLSPVSFAFWKLWGKKLFLFFSSYEWPQNLSIYLLTAITSTLKLPLFAFGFAVPLGLAGLFTTWNRDRCYLHLFTLANVFSIVAFFITDRYRLPAVAGFILLACGFFNYLFEKYKQIKIQSQLGLKYRESTFTYLRQSIFT